MKLLLSVQEMGKQLESYRHEFQGVTRKIKNANGLHETAAAFQNSHAHELECQVNLVRIEKEIAALKSEREELHRRIYGGTISNVRELNAVETEHNHVRNRLRELEGSLGGTKDKLDEATRRYKQLSEEHSAKKADWDGDKRKLIDTRNRIGKEYKLLKTKYDIQIKAVPQTLLKDYLKLVKSTSGTPIARVLEGVCQGCFIKLPLTNLEEREKSSNLPRCNTCNRILFFD